MEMNENKYEFVNSFYSFICLIYKIKFVII